MDLFVHNGRSFKLRIVNDFIATSLEYRQVMKVKVSKPAGLIF